MDVRGRFFYNVFMERLWRSVKHEKVYLKAYGSSSEARRGWGITSSSTTGKGGTGALANLHPTRSIGIRSPENRRRHADDRDELRIT